MKRNFHVDVDQNNDLDVSKKILESINELLEKVEDIDKRLKKLEKENKYTPTQRDLEKINYKIRDIHKFICRLMSYGRHKTNIPEDWTCW